MSGNSNADAPNELTTTVELNVGDQELRINEAQQFDKDRSSAVPQIEGLRIIRLLGEGGSSTVYLATDETIGQDVALKLLKIDHRDATSLRRFIQEFTIFSAESHPSIARLIDRSFTSEYAYITMEYFPGGDLSQRIAAGLSENDALHIAKSIADGLGVAHARGIIHRDIKPRNIMFREDGSLAITDFGIARLDRASDAAWAARTMTMVGQSIGTPYYMSPEQIDDSEPIDHRADLYGLGVLFFECLTGKKPFKTKSLPDLLNAHLKLPVPRLPDAVARYQELVDRLMAKKPTDRFQSAEDVASVLQEHV